ncbi:MAG: outer membrane protein assembly factor BamD [Bacteroidales bacterium]|nr:outer membrane protein assembly factor BamD [Bacteroidales bacterium]
MKNIRLYIVLLLTALMFMSCSEYQKLLKSDNSELKFERSKEYFAKGDHYRTLTLLDDLGSYFRGSAEAEEIHYMKAKSHFGNQEYSVAAYYFKTFSEVFPVSEKVEECDYMAAYCFYLLAPSASLDQSYTERGIQELQLFLDRYPNSTKQDSVNILVDKLNYRMQTKAYNNAKMFFDIGNYKAAIIALNNVLIDYPDTQYRENAMFYIVKSAFLLAQNSVESKKKQRFFDTVEHYRSFVDRFPNSKHVKEAERIYAQSVKHIN